MENVSHKSPRVSRVDGLLRRIEALGVDLREHQRRMLRVTDAPSSAAARLQTHAARRTCGRAAMARRKEIPLDSRAHEVDSALDERELQVRAHGARAAERYSSFQAFVRHGAVNSTSSTE
jgi:hypothetical protein